MGVVLLFLGTPASSSPSKDAVDAGVVTLDVLGMSSAGGLKELVSIDGRGVSVSDSFIDVSGSESGGEELCTSRVISDDVNVVLLGELVTGDELVTLPSTSGDWTVSASSARTRPDETTTAGAVVI